MLSTIALVPFLVALASGPPSSGGSRRPTVRWAIPARTCVTGDGSAMLAQIRQLLAALDLQVPMGGWTLSALVDDAFGRVRVAGTLVMYASVLVLFLSAKR